MASVQTSLCSVTSINYCFSSYSLSSVWKTSKKNNGKQYPSFKISCNSTNNDDTANNVDKSSAEMFDRRNILLGLGSLYGTANMTANQLAIADPVAPDFSKCGPAEFLEGGVISTNCCPPAWESKISDFKFPRSSKLRERPAAHLADDEYVYKFEKAIQLMKELPKNDPRNFYQQANVHCAYCNGAYPEVKNPEVIQDIDLQVHFSWLFFPFHRWYLYFYEKILGHLIDDPTFALPFWNWDAPRGMKIPSMFLDPCSSLYDEKRNQDHLFKVVDLSYNGNGKDTKAFFADERRKQRCGPDRKQISNNLSLMYKHMVNASTTELFFGLKYIAGQEPYNLNTGAGSIERQPHTPIHIWVGDPKEDHNEDLGNFYSAGRDVLFYSHHSNVDRMWTIWKTLDRRGQKSRRDITDTDWLESSFLFYDENAKLIRVKVRDCLDTNKLGYTYQDVPKPWRHSKPTPKVVKSDVATRSRATVSPVTGVTFPAALDNTIKVLVTRPKRSRSMKEKEAEEEILVIEGIEFDREKYVKFDVYVNDEDDKESAQPDQTEFAGSFVSLTHTHKHGRKGRANLKLGITELLEDLEADDDETLLVTLIPRSETNDVTISGINIELSPVVF